MVTHSIELELEAEAEFNRPTELEMTDMTRKGYVPHRVAS